MARPGLVLLIAMVISACGPVSKSIPGQTTPTPTGNRLPPCTSMTATGCDNSAIKNNGRGSPGCVGKGPGTLTASPIALSDIAFER